MSKLLLDAQKERAEAVASEELLASINGGTENACHDAAPSQPEMIEQTGNPIVDPIIGLINLWRIITHGF